MLWLKKKRDQCPTLHVRQNAPNGDIPAENFPTSGRQPPYG